MGHSEICASIKGGYDPRTDGRAQDRGLKRLGGDRKGEERVGRFFANEKVTAAKIIEGWSALTGAACAGRHVLAIDDTSETKFPTTAQRRRGLGPTKKGNAYGVLVHAMIAVDAMSGACLGLVGGEVWNRPGVNPVPHRERPPEERESMRWLNAAAQAKQVLKPAAIACPCEGGGSPWWTIAYRTSTPNGSRWR